MQYGDHDPEDAHQAPLKTTGAHAVDNPLVMNQYKALEERLKVVEGFDAFEVDTLEMGLVPDVVIPAKFNVPDFSKYKGLTCLRNHICMYCRKMHAHAHDQKLMIHCFQDCLIGASLEW